MAWRGSISRSFLSTARASTFRSAPPLPRLRPPSLSAPPTLRPRCLYFSNPRTMGELGGAQSLLPLYRTAAGAQLTSHLTANLRAFCELSHGTFRRTCQDR
ncbi:hypothetical protein ACH5RR_022237 [Cinchona calisaya]|uniref:Uncharacterized protein n=1 Tax=Cinchona calisaya TaxID=153742 RepID=A0ABD2ZAI6_9GENT